MRSDLRLAAALLLLALATGACARPASDAAPTGAPAATSAATAPAAAPAPTSAPTSAPAAAPIPAGSFQNPVLKRDFPDPDVVAVGGTFYAFATNSGGRNVQTATSPDMISWQLGPDAMPTLPPWVRLSGPDVWAPEVIQVGERFALFFTARHAESGRQCIGVAVAEAIDARFRPASDEPLVCQVEEGGSIDASPFRDGDQLYLYWKNDGNCCSQPTHLYVQPLAPDGLSLTGEPNRLVRNDAAWEGGVVEAPTMVREGDGYFLFFSANDYGGLKYAVGYATCETPIGPCADAPENPILASKIDQPPLVVGPGHQDVIAVGDELWVVYHAWEVLSSGTRGGRRFMWLDRLEWAGGKPDIMGPTVDPQPAPDL